MLWKKQVLKIANMITMKNVAEELEDKDEGKLL